MTLTKFQLYVDGAFVDAAETFLSLDPSTGEPWAEMPKAGVEDTCRAVEAAHRALTSGDWPAFTATERGKLLSRLADLVAANADRLAELETRDTGKIIRETRAQVGYVAEYYRYFAGLADKVQGAHLPIDKHDMEVTVRREPIGVVAAVVPWNSQMFLAAVKLAPALAAGCTVVLKASEDGPAPLLEFARLIDAAGTPKGVVNVVTGFGEECGRVLTSHPLVSRVAFTGGPATARHVVRNTADNFAHTTLELGGKSPVLVFADADLDSVTNSVIAGIYAASGQSCVAGSRLYVQRAAHDRLIDAIAAKARRIVIGDPQDPKTEMGPLATRRQVDGIEAVIKQSVRRGRQDRHRGQAPGTLRKRLLLRADADRVRRCGDGLRSGGTVRTRPQRHPVRGRGRRAGEGERQPIRARLRAFHARSLAGASPGQVRAQRHRLGEHVPGGVPDGAVRRLRAVGLRARGRPRVDPRLYQDQDRLDSDLRRSHPRSIRDEVSDDMILEMRSYRMKVGAVPAYLRIVGEEGIEVQQSHLGQLAGYFFTEIGPLNEIVHMWAYADLVDRDNRRTALAADPRWQAVLEKIIPLIETMNSKILKPTAFSPIR